MKRFHLLPYAVVGLVLVIWWALTQSTIALGLFLVMLVVAAIHVVKYSSSPGGIASEQDRVEGKARASFPLPPESRRGV